MYTYIILQYNNDGVSVVSCAIPTHSQPLINQLIRRLFHPIRVKFHVELISLPSAPPIPFPVVFDVISAQRVCNNDYYYYY